jgi:hypothetical protein
MFAAKALLTVVAGIATGLIDITPPDARKELEELAKTLAYFSNYDFVANRFDDSGIPPKMAADYRRGIGRLVSRNYEVKVLVELLRHDNPRVRTLAAAALYARLDPKLLPHIAPLTKDTAETFPTHRPPSYTQSDSPPPLVKQKVGEAVGTMVRMYLGGAGSFDFPDYWAKRKDRTHCASWFAVQLYWADGGTFPTPPERVEAVKRVRRKIDRVPEPDRTFILLWLVGVWRPNDALATEGELVEACRKLGPDPLVKLLSREIPSDDPDLQPRPSNNDRYGQMMRFVLRHPDLLRPEDADMLLTRARWEADYRKHGITDPLLTTDWHTAAAELRRRR